MEIVTGRCYKFVVKLPWGERKAFTCKAARRDEDGTIHWEETGGVGLDPFCDCITTETDTWVSGFLGGTVDATVVIACEDEENAPEP